jgi:hypothetical protein
MAAALKEPLGRWTGRIGMGLSAFAAIGFAAVTIGLMAEYGDAPDLVWAIVTAGLFILAGAAAIVLAWKREATTAILAAGGIGILAHAMFFGQFGPRLEPLWPARRVEMALERTGLDPRSGRTPGPVEVAGYSEASLVFALGTHTGLGGPEDAVRALAEGRPAIVEKREEAEFRNLMARRGLTPRPVTRLEAFNYSNGDPMSLTFYRGDPRPTVMERQPAAATPSARALIRGDVRP